VVYVAVIRSIPAPRYATTEPVKRALFLAITAFLLSCSSADPPASCGPFGAPSAAVFSKVLPNCGNGQLLGPWQDADKIDRYACLYQPKSAAANSKLPMLVYLHPSLFSAGWITQTNILELQDSVSLTDDPKNVGYIVLAPEGRKTTHYYPFPDNKGIGWDNWYRQLNPAGDVKIGNTTWRENADAATIDHFIATEVATGNVDTNRIYVSGWSNGAAMGLLYAVNRPNIAAAAVYSAPIRSARSTIHARRRRSPDRPPVTNRFRSSIRLPESCMFTTPATSAASVPTTSNSRPNSTPPEWSSMT